MILALGQAKFIRFAICFTSNPPDIGCPESLSAEIILKVF